jgi:hypothetical protein
MTKYLSWKADLALNEDGTRFYARMRELTAEVDDDYEEVPAFCLDLPIERILPLTNPQFHGDISAEWTDEQEAGEPIVFEPA